MHYGHFTGYLGKDAETRFMPSGDAVANFSLGVSAGTKDQPKTIWVDCSLFGNRAEALSGYLAKGTPVSVCGDVDIRLYAKNDGTGGGSLTCRVDKLTFAGKASDRTGQSEPAAPRQQPAPQRQAAGPPADDFDDDSIPF
jgi:single-strand DNA-binding protein